MPAVLDTPVCTPPGASEPFRAPAPTVLCESCGGLDPDLDFEPPVCLDCNGCGLAPIGFRLLATRSHGYRFVCWEPGRQLLTVKTATQPHNRETVGVYSIAEKPHDWPGRSFAVAKLNAVDRLHEVYIGPDAVSCSCEGNTYLTSAKANQKAFEQGEETFPGHGCCHSDALAALVASGWFDG